MSRYTVQGEYLCEYVDHCTCGAGTGGYYGAHEPGCGLEMVGPIEQVVDGYDALKKALNLARNGLAWAQPLLPTAEGRLRMQEWIDRVRELEHATQPASEPTPEVNHGPLPSGGFWAGFCSNESCNVLGCPGDCQSPAKPFMPVQDAIETAILARGVEPPEDLADIIFVAAEAVQPFLAPSTPVAPAPDTAAVLAELAEKMTKLAAVDTDAEDLPDYEYGVHDGLVSAARMVEAERAKREIR